MTRVMAISDVHADFEENARWATSLSLWDHRSDVLIVAGDVSDRLPMLQKTLEALASRFDTVLFVPGNHELWVARDGPGAGDSLQKFERVQHAARQCGVLTGTLRQPGLRVVPLHSWYDHSFGEPGPELRRVWADFVACRWPEGWQAPDVAREMFARNLPEPPRAEGETIVSFSHFMPRIDLMPAGVPDRVRMLFPVLGASRLDAEIRRLQASVHVYGHSHLNRDRLIDGVRYLNNAYGYPHETAITAKRLLTVWER